MGDRVTNQGDDVVEESARGGANKGHEAPDEGHGEQSLNSQC